MMTALHFFVFGGGHVVAQVVETKFVVRAIGDVCGIVATLFLGRRTHARNHETNFKTHPTVNAAHPLSVKARQVVVHRDDVNTFS